MVKCALVTFGIIFGVIGVILMIVLLSISWRVIEENEMGLLFNVASRHFDREQIYEAGRHYVNVGNYFVKFPKTSQILEVDGMEARTSDGLALVVDISFNYRIVQDVETLLRIYERYGADQEEYSKILRKMASNIVRDACSMFESYAFFQNRDGIVQSINAVFKTDLEPMGFIIDSFQLLDFNFPPEFTASIEETQVAYQEITKVLYEGQAATVEAETLMAVAEKECEGILLNAKGTANATLSEKKQAADALKESLATEADAYLQLMQKLGIDAEQLVSWLWTNAMSQTNAQKVTVVPQPSNVNFKN